VVLTTRAPLSGSYNPHKVSHPSSSLVPITQTVGWLLAMVCGIVIVIPGHVDPSPPHTPHASYSLPLLQTPHWKKAILNLEILLSWQPRTLSMEPEWKSDDEMWITRLIFSDRRGQLPSISVSQALQFVYSIMRPLSQPISQSDW